MESVSLLKSDPQFAIQIVSDTAELLDIHFSGRMDVQTFSSAKMKVFPLLLKTKAKKIQIDLAQVSYFDDFGALFLIKLKQLAYENNLQFSLQHMSDAIEQIFSVTKFSKDIPIISIRKTKTNPLALRAGTVIFQKIKAFKQLIAFLGNLLISIYELIRKPKLLRWNDTLLFMESVGVNALPVVGMIGFLLGIVIAFIAATQLRPFSAESFVAPLVSLTMVSELGPIMTGILVAGRSGSAFAAEIGTMMISQEVDALTVMGFQPTKFLVIPRMLAAALMLPILTIFSNFFSIMGGMIVGMSVLEIPYGAYLAQSMDILSIFEVFWGLGKSVLFALIIAGVGCLRGFQVRGGADAVGKAATSAVVTSIFLIILADSILAVLRSIW